MSLGMAMSEIKARVAHHQGWSLGTDYSETAWTDRQSFDLNHMVKAGLDRFYRPHVPGALDAGYAWSFLRPVAQLTLESGARTVVMPDDFGGLEGERITVSRTSSSGYSQLSITGDVRRYYQLSNDATGAPQWASWEVKKGGGRTWDEWLLQVYPQADQNYTLEIPYFLHGTALTEQFPYHLGGPEHSQTVLEACLAVSEEALDDMPALSGPHGQAFVSRLLASVAVDRRKKAQTIGYCGDGSDDHYYGRRRRMTEDPVITFDGVQYD